MTSYIRKFNEQMVKFEHNLKENSVMNLIIDIKREKNIRDYYSTVEYISSVIGITYVIVVTDKSTYMPIVKINKINSFGIESREISHSSYDSSISSLDRAYMYAAKEYIIFLMRQEKSVEVLTALNK